MELYQQLEQQIGEWCGNPNVVACSSGTAALHLALETLALPQGSEVIVPEFTMIACARAVTIAGLKPIFIDCQDDLLLSTNSLSEILTSNTKAIMPVHIYGRRCNMQKIVEFSKKHGLAIVEDLAEAHGVLPHSSSDAACWSFYRNKIVAGEEGGAIAFSNPEHVTRAKQLRSLGFTTQHNFLHLPRGVNARLSNVHAQIISRSLECIKSNLFRRRQVEQWYQDRVPQDWLMPPRRVCWVYDICLRGIDTAQVVMDLNRQGIAARLAFKPMSQQPEYKSLYKHLVAYQMSKEVIYLPVSPKMTESAVDDIISAVVPSTLIGGV